MKHFLLLIAIVVLSSALSACGTGESGRSFAATVPVAQGIALQPTATASDTPTATHTPTNTLTPTSTYTPTYTPTPTATLTPTITPSPTATLTPTITNTPTPIPTATFADPADDPNYTPPPSWTPPPIDAGALAPDRYTFRRPISSANRDWLDRTYPYGSTGGGRYGVHLGVDFQNPSGTPVLAAGNGTVYYAGDDVTRVFGPRPNYYGNVVVLQHAPNADGLMTFTLYGHLSRVDVLTGQTVAAGEQLGAVGAAGIAIGPHLHFEVRVGNPDNFMSTRNPDLWILPYYGYGTIAGTVRSASGAVLRDVTVQVETASGERDVPRYAFSYADDTVNGDSQIGENFTLGDLPATYYDVTVRANGRRLFQQIMYVYPNKTTRLDIVLN